MKIFHRHLEIQTNRTLDFIDITDDVILTVKGSGIKNGLVSIQSPHSTAAIHVNENEPLLIEDMRDALERLVPQDIIYRHDDFTIRTVNMCDDECDNGHAHIKRTLIGGCQSLHIIDGKMELGNWLKIFLVECDRPRKRKVSIMVMGE